MAVAVKNTPDTTTRLAVNRLAMESFGGVLYLLGSIGLVFYGIPAVWAAGPDQWLSTISEPVSVAIRILVMVLAALGLVALGLRLLGPAPRAGVRAGIFVGAIEVVAALLLACFLGQLLERQAWGAENGAAGLGITAVVALVLLGLIYYGFTRPRFERRILQFEEQGWFTAHSYKRSQGQRVRRGTIMAILVLAGCGIYTILVHRSLETGQPNLEVRIPFTEWVWILLPQMRFTVPLLLALGSLWLAYRIVNLPVFADFLIATEAEINKVSWTTRKRLVQDTIVVLVTVFLLTVFLFAVDQMWGWALTRVGVIQLPPPDTQQESQRELGY